MAKSIFTGQEISEDNPYAAAGSGVGYTNPYVVDSLETSQRQEQYVAENMQAFTEKVESGQGLSTDDLEMTARAFIDGLWLNKSEEVGSYIGATMVKLFNPELVQDKTISQIASEMKTDLEAESAVFAEENPWTAGIANVAGSVLSPVSLAGGRVLSEAAKLRQGAQGASSVDEVASMIGGTFAPRSKKATDLAEQLGQQQATGRMSLGKLYNVPVPGSGQLTQAVSNVRTPVAGAAFAGAEGAVIGFEGEDLQDKAINATFTAGISATVPFAFAGVKKGYDFFTEPKMAQQVGEGADFVNLMFTDHGLSQVYRSVLSKAYGGRTLSEQQARKIAGRALTPAAANRAASELKAEAARKTKLAKEAINRNNSEALEEINLRFDDQIAEAKRLAKESEGARKVEQENKIAELEEAKSNASLAKVLAVKEADEAVNSANAAFRGQALRQSAPSGASVDEINSLGAMDPQDANRALDQLWKQYGFKFANGKSYQINAEDAVSFINSIRDDYSDLALVGAERGGIIGTVTQYITKEITTKAPDGVIRGEDLLNLRSTIGRAINGLSEGSVSTRRFSSEVQDYFNNLLESGLSKAEKEAFDADRYAWSVRSIVDDAIAGASKGGTQIREGAFNASDYLNSVKSFSSRFAARGQGRLQQEAQTAAKLAQTNKENILALADDQVREVAKQTIKDKALLRRDLAKQKDAIAKQRDAEIAALNKERANLKVDSEGRAALQRRIEDVKNRFSIQLSDIDKQISKATQETEALKNMMPSTFKGSVFENLFNTALVGQAVLFATPAASESINKTLLSGGIGARILLQESSQRILARQSSGQAALRRNIAAMGQGVESREGFAPSVAGQMFAPKEAMFSEDRRQVIDNLPISGKAALYRNLKANNRLERLKAEDPKLFKELEKAFNAAR